MHVVSKKSIVDQLLGDSALLAEFFGLLVLSHYGQQHRQTYELFLWIVSKRTINLFGLAVIRVV